MDTSINEGDITHTPIPEKQSKVNKAEMGVSTKELPKEVLETAVSLKIKIEKYYDQLDKQVADRSNR
jgi:KaiC/GvpD/RAD55 family RecA-like ATPase